MMIGHSWQKYYNNGKDIEKYLIGFIFRGPGWYSTETDTLYVEKLGDRYHVWCWNYPNGRQDYIEDAIIHLTAPVYT